MVNSFDQVMCLVKQGDIEPLYVASDFHAEATELRLSAERYDALVTALDGPTMPKPRLEELMKTPTAFDRESEPIRATNDGVDESGGQTDYEADLRA